MSKHSLFTVSLCIIQFVKKDPSICFYYISQSQLFWEQGLYIKTASWTGKVPAPNLPCVFFLCFPYCIFIYCYCQSRRVGTIETWPFFSHQELCTVMLFILYMLSLTLTGRKQPYSVTISPEKKFITVKSNQSYCYTVCKAHVLFLYFRLSI